MTLPTLLFVEMHEGWFLSAADVPNRVLYSAELGRLCKWKAHASNKDGTREVQLGHHPDLNAAMKACEAHFLRQRPA